MKKEIEVEVEPDVKVIGEPSYCLQTGYAFKYKGKEWNPEIITDEAIKTSKVIGKQNIHDVDCIVFKDADGNKWAQAIQTCRGKMKKAKEPKKSCASEPSRYDEDDISLLKSLGFEHSVVSGSVCYIKKDKKGKYTVYLPGDSRSNKFEMSYQTSDNSIRTDFKPSTVRGIIKQMKEHQKSNVSEPKRKPGRPRKISEPGPLPPMKLNGCPPKGAEPLGCDVGKRKRTLPVQEPREVSFKTKKGVKTFTADKEKAAQRKKEKRAMRYNPIRAAIEKDYQISRGGMIKSPGKFEGEMIYMPYFFGVFMEGGADGEDERGRITVSVSKEDRLIFPELGKTRKHVIFNVDDYGFVNELFRR